MIWWKTRIQFAVLLQYIVDVVMEYVVYGSQAFLLFDKKAGERERERKRVLIAYCSNSTCNWMTNFQAWNRHASLQRKKNYTNTNLNM